MSDEPVPVSAEVFGYGTTLAEVESKVDRLQLQVDALRRELLTMARILAERERP